LHWDTVQTPFEQVAPVPLGTVQAVPLGAFGFVQTGEPAGAEQVPTTWQASCAVQTVPPERQLPAPSQ
jgi:hypothetical protein